MFHPFSTSRAKRRLASLALAGAAVVGSVAVGSPASADAPIKSRDPVLFVHGFTRTSADFATYKDFFLQTGWSADQLFTIDYNSFYPNYYAALAIRAKVEEIKASTGAAKVDIIAHSMGAFGARYYLKNLGGTASVDTFVSISGPNHGTLAAYSPQCLAIPSCDEMRPDSAFLTQLNAGDETPGDVKYVTLRTPGDDLVFPSSSTELDGATNHVSDQIVTHLEYAVTQEAISLSRNAVRRSSILN